MTRKRKATGPKKTRVIEVGALARVEGEGALKVRIEGDRVTQVALEIYEPPRFFEALLRGRHFTESPDITARICGICPVAYQMSAVHAMEAACGCAVPPPIRSLRRLLYCGEWIESHVLHIYMLHAPDFLGYAGAIEMAKDHAERVRRGLEMKKAGNALVACLGGRSVHPVNVRVGGFYRAPTKQELRDLLDPLRYALDGAVESVRWTASLPFPEADFDYLFLALRHPSEYPMNEGRLASSAGLDIPAEAFSDHVREEHVAHSTALHATLDGETYLAGPLARFHLNRDRLTPRARDLAEEVGLAQGCKNPFRSIVVRGIEVVLAFEESLRLIEAYEPPSVPHVEVEPRCGVGHWATEAPRGLLYHRYTLDADGTIREASIVPPTSQNQRAIEADVARVVARSLDLSHDALRHRCEQTIRNYDPCISCSTHFLRLEMERTKVGFQPVEETGIPDPGPHTGSPVAEGES